MSSFEFYDLSRKRQQMPASSQHRHLDASSETSNAPNLGERLPRRSRFRMWQTLRAGAIALVALVAIASDGMASPQPQAQVEPGVESAPDVEIEAATLSPTELERLIFALQGIQQLQLRPQQAAEIAALLAELQQREIVGETIELDPRQTQQLRALFGSLSSVESTALNLILLAAPPQTTVTLTSEQIDAFLAIVQRLPTEDLSLLQRRNFSQLQRYLQSLRELDRPEVRLNADESGPFLVALASIYLRDRAIAARGSYFSAEQLQQTLEYLRAVDKTLDLDPEREQTLQSLLAGLQSSSMSADGQIRIVAPEQTQQLQVLLASFSESERKRLRRQLNVDRGGSLISPAISIITPIGYGGSYGVAGVGLFYQDSTRFGGNSDGALSASVGLGDPDNAIGFTTSLAIFSLTNRGGDDDAFENGSLSFKISRNLPGQAAISLGVENLIFWPEDENDAGTSTYLVGSKLFRLREDIFAPLSIAYLTVGVGNGRFRPPEDFDRVDDGFQFNPFGSVAVQLVRGANAIAEWSGQDLDIGVSLVPFRRIPAVVTLSLLDLTGNAEEEFGAEGEPRFTASASYVIFF